VLFINAIAILNEERFLARIGWSTAQAAQHAQGEPYSQPYGEPAFGGAPGGGMNGAEPGVKERIITLISAVRTLMRIPLIAVNVLIIMYELVLGG